MKISKGNAVKFGAGGLGALAVTALAATGLANALWTETTTINGQLNTGELNMGWEDVATSDNDAGFGAAGGTCSATIVEPGLNVVDLTINNAYPGYQCVTNVQVHNFGTVPGKVTGVAWGPHNPAILMSDGGSTVQTNSVVMPGAEGLYKLTVTVDPTATEAQLAEASGPFSVPVILNFANALPPT